jgi:hypothetical protein
MAYAAGTSVAYQRQVQDFSAEKSAYGFFVAAATNIEAGIPPVIAAIDTAYGVLCDGAVVSRTETIVVKAPPVGRFDGSGNREDKWLVEYHDAITNKRLTLTLPCRRAPDGTTIIMSPGSDFLDATCSAYTGFKTAFEAGALSDVGNAVVLDAIRLVGRNI